MFPSLLSYGIFFRFSIICTLPFSFIRRANIPQVCEEVGLRSSADKSLDPLFQPVVQAPAQTTLQKGGEKNKREAFSVGSGQSGWKFLFCVSLSGRLKGFLRTFSLSLSFMCVYKSSS